MRSRSERQQPTSSDASSKSPVSPKTPKSPMKSLLQWASSERLADQRRRALTQVDVIAESLAHGPLALWRLLGAAVGLVAYSQYLLPHIQNFGVNNWSLLVSANLHEARLGGPYAEVGWAYALLVSIAYVSCVVLGVRQMERRRPVSMMIFELTVAYNCTLCFLNLYCFINICREARALDFSFYGNSRDATPLGYRLGSLIWLQYHCRQLELLGTAFMVLRKTFQRISYLHLYHRVLNLWGWYFACRFCCGGDTYFPALITSACQAVVYLYFSGSLLGVRKGVFLRRALLMEVQIVQYVFCAAHNIFEAARGELPPGLAMLHLFVILNGLLLYMDFHYEEQKPERSEKAANSGEPRVTFSFDSCGWLMVYHFGVAHWLQQHMLAGVTPENAGTSAYPKGIAFSGSSGGALIAAVLGAGTHIPDVFQFFLEQHAECLENPCRMFPAVDRALRKFQYPGAHKFLSGRVRVLLTRVSPKPPFVMGEVVDTFASNEIGITTLCASCHVPLMAGILPYKIEDRYYYDGMAWPSSFLVPWRAARGDLVIRISAMGAPLSDIRVSAAPLWWGLLPPSISLLRGLFWMGYRDAAVYFSAEPEAPSSAGICREGRKNSLDLSEGSAVPAEKDPDIAKWQAARALVRIPLKPVSQQLPAVDPTSGEDVMILISRFQASAEQANRLLGCTLAGLFVLVSSVVFALQPLSPT